MMKEFELAECEYPAECIVCEKPTLWRLVTERDIHVCSQECFLKAEEDGMLGGVVICTTTT